MAGITPLDQPRLTLSPLSQKDAADVAVELTNMLREINSDFGTKFIVIRDLRDSRPGTTTDFASASSVEQVSATVFTSLNALPESFPGREELLHQAAIYREKFAKYASPLPTSADKVKSLADTAGVTPIETTTGEASSVSSSSSLPPRSTSSSTGIVSPQPSALSPQPF